MSPALPTEARAPGGAAAVLENALAGHLANPFVVLALPPSASAGEVERQGDKLLAMLAAGLTEAASYPTPVGPRARTPELVRSALAELRDPARRLRAEWWAQGWRQAWPPGAPRGSQPGLQPGSQEGRPRP
jgi:hypothetical protein